MIDVLLQAPVNALVHARVHCLFIPARIVERRLFHLLTLSKTLRPSKEIRLVVGTDIAPESAAIGRHISGPPLIVLDPRGRRALLNRIRFYRREIGRNPEFIKLFVCPTVNCGSTYGLCRM